LAAKQEGVKDRVVYHGYKAVGPDLFAYYVAADIYVIASQSCFEGFPRTIWEAMAHSLPVVATRVGSIPDFIEGAAELVEPKNHIALADGILKIIKTPELRKRNIRNGYSLAEKNTLEEQVGEMATHIIDWIRK
jgi:glycosyltransferase involved in cell wall biosynthesis